MLKYATGDFWRKPFPKPFQKPSSLSPNALNWKLEQTLFLGGRAAKLRFASHEEVHDANEGSRRDVGQVAKQGEKDEKDTYVGVS